MLMILGGGTVGGGTVLNRKKLYFQIGNISQARKQSNSYGFSNIYIPRDSKSEYFFAL